MRTIQINQAFTLRMTPDSVKHFNPGLHTVEDDVADHWYVKAHIGAAPALDALAAERAELQRQQVEHADAARALAAERAAFEAEKTAASAPAPAASKKADPKA